MVEEPGVREAAGEGANKEEEEDFDRADPGDVGGGSAEGADVVGLVNAEGVYHAPGTVSMRTRVEQGKKYQVFMTTKCVPRAGQDRVSRSFQHHVS